MWDTELRWYSLHSILLGDTAKIMIPFIRCVALISVCINSAGEAEASSAAACVRFHERGAGWARLAACMHTCRSRSAAPDISHCVRFGIAIFSPLPNIPDWMEYMLFHSVFVYIGQVPLQNRDSSTPNDCYTYVLPPYR